MYHLVSAWSVRAPIEVVWEAVYHSERWPEWWRGLESVVELERGDDEGIGNRRRYSWRGRLPYRLVFDMTATRIEPPRRLEGRARGDVDGLGCWRLRGEGAWTVVRYDWHVWLNKPWMRRLSPWAWPLFRWNHDVVMRWGAEGMAAHLGARMAHRPA